MSNNKEYIGILPKDFDIGKLKYGDVKPLDPAGMAKIVWISYENGPLVFQTPEMVAPFGVATWLKDDGKKKVDLTLSFKGKDNRLETLGKFYDNLLDMDSKIIAEAFDKSFLWLKKKASSEEVVKALYTPIIKHPKDKETGEITTKWPSTFKASLPEKDGRPDFEVYTADRKRVDLSAVEMKGAKVTALIQCLGIWLAGGKFGVSWKILQMKVSPIKKIEGYSIRDDVEDKVEDDDEEDVKNDEEIMDNAEIKSGEDCGIVESDDELEMKKEDSVPKKTGRGKKAPTFS